MSANHLYFEDYHPSIQEVVGTAWRRYMLPSILHPCGLVASYIDYIESQLGVWVEESDWPELVSQGVDGAVEWLQARVEAGVC